MFFGVSRALGPAPVWPEGQGQMRGGLSRRKANRPFPSLEMVRFPCVEMQFLDRPEADKWRISDG